MSTEGMTIIEINGVKLEVDLRQARRVDQLKIGSRVKCLVKKYNDWVTRPGVIVGFEPFKELPTIVVAYLESDYSSADIKFVSINTAVKDFEIVADLDQNALEIDRKHVLGLIDRDLNKKLTEIRELEAKRQYFLDKFGEFFGDVLTMGERE